MVRGIAGAVAGIFVGVFAILLVAMVGQAIAPLPLGPDDVGVSGSELSVAGLLFVLLAWATGAWIGGWLARRVAGSNGPVLATILVLLLTSVYNLSALPNPIWFWVLGVLTFPVLGLLGARAVRGPAPAAATH